MGHVSKQGLGTQLKIKAASHLLSFIVIKMGSSEIFWFHESLGGGVMPDISQGRRPGSCFSLGGMFVQKNDFMLAYDLTYPEIDCI